MDVFWLDRKTYYSGTPLTLGLFSIVVLYTLSGRPREAGSVDGRLILVCLPRSTLFVFWVYPLGVLVLLVIEPQFLMILKSYQTSCRYMSTMWFVRDPSTSQRFRDPSIRILIEQTDRTDDVSRSTKKHRIMSGRVITKVHHPGSNRESTLCHILTLWVLSTRPSRVCVCFSLGKGTGSRLGLTGVKTEVGSTRNIDSRINASRGSVRVVVLDVSLKFLLQPAPVRFSFPLSSVLPSPIPYFPILFLSFP